jgi:hypothetical protein
MRIIPLATMMALVLACSMTVYAGDTGGNGGSMQSPPVGSTLSPRTDSVKQKPPDPWEKKAEPRQRTSGTPASLKGKPVSKPLSMPPDPWDKKAEPQNKTAHTPANLKRKPVNESVSMPPDPLDNKAKPQNKTANTRANPKNKPANSPVSMPPDPLGKNAGKVK